MDSAVKLYHLSFHTTFEGLVKAVLRKLLIDSNVWYVFIPSGYIGDIFWCDYSDVVVSVCFEKTPDYKTFIWIVAFINNNLKF